MQLVSEVMTRQVQSVSPRDSVRRAAQMMDDLNVGALPVCDGERLVGMVTDRDITVRATSAGLSPEDTLVEQVMSADVRTCQESQALDEVMRQMADTQIRRVPVVSQDDPARLIGIVSLGDIATRSSDGAQGSEVGAVVGKVSFPSQPDLSSRPEAVGAAPSAGGSDTGTATGLAGSDIVDDRLNPRYEVSATADPSDIVEVTPKDLVNRNAPGSATLRNPTAGTQQAAPTVIRRGGDDAGTGASGAPGGSDVAGATGASGGSAGTAGTAGSDAGAQP